jgi:anti-sigma factor RsiW
MVEQLDDSTLVAYVDGELDDASAAEVESALASDPAAQSRVQVFRETSRVLRVTFGKPSREPVSPSLSEVSERGAAVGRWRHALPLAASLLAFAVSLGGGYMAGLYHGQAQVEVSAVEHWLEEAAKYYQLYARDSEYLVEIPASAAVKIEHRLSGWFDRELRVPDLSGHGLKFRGVRFLALEADPAMPDEAQPAALLVYDLPNGQSLGVCITAFSGQDGEAQQLSSKAGLNLLYWFESGYAHILMGKTEPDVLRFTRKQDRGKPC